MVRIKFENARGYPRCEIIVIRLKIKQGNETRQFIYASIEHSETESIFYIS